MRLGVMCAAAAAAAGGTMWLCPEASALRIRGLTGAREMCTKARNVAQAVQQAQRSCTSDANPALRATSLAGTHTIVSDFAPDAIVFTTFGEHLTDFDSVAGGFYEWTVGVEVEGNTAAGASAEAGVDSVVHFEADGGATMRFATDSVAGATPDATVTMTDGGGVVVGQVVIGFGAAGGEAEIAFPAPGAYDVRIEWTWASGELPIGGFEYGSGLHRIEWSFDPQPCQADLDGDGAVGAADLALMLGAWGTISSLADLNFDGVVNAADLAQLLGGWGVCG